MERLRIFAAVALFVCLDALLFGNLFFWGTHIQLTAILVVALSLHISQWPSLAIAILLGIIDDSMRMVPLGIACISYVVSAKTAIVLGAFAANGFQRAIVVALSTSLAITVYCLIGVLVGEFYFDPLVLSVAVAVNAAAGFIFFPVVVKLCMPSVARESSRWL